MCSSDLMSSYPSITFGYPGKDGKVFLSANLQFQQPKELFISKAAPPYLAKLCDTIQQATDAKLYVLKGKKIKTAQPLNVTPEQLLDPIRFPTLDVAQCNPTYLKCIKSILETELFDTLSGQNQTDEMPIIAIGYELDTASVWDTAQLMGKVELLVPYVQYLADLNLQLVSQTI